MRKAMVLAVLLVMAGSALAADTFQTGTWKLNQSKSKSSSPTPSNTVESILVFREIEGDLMEGTQTVTRKDGSVVVTKWTTPKNGGVQKYQQGGPAQGVMVVSTVVDSNTAYNTFLRDGKQIQVMHVVNGGKTITIVAKGTNAQGQPFESTSVFEKQ